MKAVRVGSLAVPGGPPQGAYDLADGGEPQQNRWEKEDMNTFIFIVFLYVGIIGGLAISMMWLIGRKP